MVVLDHRDESGVGLSQFGELLNCVLVNLVERVFSFEVLEELYILGGEIVDLLTE